MVFPLRRRQPTTTATAPSRVLILRSSTSPLFSPPTNTHPILKLFHCSYTLYTRGWWPRWCPWIYYVRSIFPPLTHPPPPPQNKRQYSFTVVSSVYVVPIIMVLTLKFGVVTGIPILLHLLHCKREPVDRK